ncbi:MAG: U32 family peptidase [Thiohalorhabdus sp.]|uniref:ubiquinone anaerobic biosynthesis protein UbiV n=1 Tax=Thiohalorhabdus sp. TaxID=3094134 RepID=UPI00397EB3AD
MKLALGPIQYFWSAEAVRDFYARARDWPVDIVYLGEVVCGKRRALGPDDWLEVAAELAAAGKEVVLSTQALLEADSELAGLKRMCANGQFSVEANDMGAVHLLTGTEGFVAGPHINAYNGETLALLHELGAQRWVLPVELSRETLAALQAERPADLQTEVFAFGRLPLAFSARCFTARAHNLPKDQCYFRCGEDPDGKGLYTQEDQHLFTINGIQLQSGAPCNLVWATDELRELGVDVLRISPQSFETEVVVEAFRAAADGERDPLAAEADLAHLGADGWCNGYWYGTAGMRTGMEP